jgi:bifunctional non-homologous end joining protein LigD
VDVRDKRIDSFVGRCIGIFPNREKAEWGEGLTAEDMKRCHWLKPQLVVEFLEWTRDKHLRHPKFIALRGERIARETT